MSSIDFKTISISDLAALVNAKFAEHDMKTVLVGGACVIGAWHAFLPKILQELSSEEEADLEVEVWSYNPALFAKGKLVDSFSLSLSLGEITGDRVKIASDKMMEQLKW